MKVAGLISGGKDSVFNLMRCAAEGHTIACIVSLVPSQEDSDSHMFQTVGLNAVHKIAEAIGVPIIVKDLRGGSLNQNADYVVCKGDEVEDMYEALKEACEKFNFEAVSSGAIASNYQRVRVESVCNRLGLKSLAYLWGRSQSELLNEMVAFGMEAMIIRVGAMGLSSALVGNIISDEICSDLISNEYINCCGEGGEFETLCIDAGHFFQKRLAIKNSSVIVTSQDEYAPAAYLSISSIETLSKDCPPSNWKFDYHGKLKARFFEDLISESSRLCNDSTLILPEVKKPLHCLEQYTTVNYSFNWCSVYIICKNLSSTLTSLQLHEGYQLSNAVAVQLYIPDINDYAAINKEYVSALGLGIDSIGPPSRIVVSLSCDCIIFCALIPHESVSRNHHHVQSISDWGPSNIGPYSHLIKANSVKWLAGQISLVPATMKLLDSTIFAHHACLALRHVKRLSHVFGEASPVFAFCYITDISYSDIIYNIWNYECPLHVCEVAAMPRESPVEWEVAFAEDIELVACQIASCSISFVHQSNLCFHASSFVNLPECFAFIRKHCIQHNVINLRVHCLSAVFGEARTFMADQSIPFYIIPFTNLGSNLMVSLVFVCEDNL